MANAKSQSASLPTAEQYVAEYVARKLNGEKPAKLSRPSIIDRLTTAVENTVVDTVADSKRIGGRVSAAWEAAQEGYEDAYALETKRQGERAARRLGLH